MRGGSHRDEYRHCGPGEVGWPSLIDAIKEIVPQLHTRKGTRGWHGVQIRPLDRAKAAVLGPKRLRGCTCMKSCLPNQRIRLALSPAM